MEKDNDMPDRPAFLLKWCIIFLLALLFALAITGCNTMAGLGKDIHAAATGIQDRMSEPDAPDTPPAYTASR